jgi:hypothetical protein
MRLAIRQSTSQHSATPAAAFMIASASRLLFAYSLATEQLNAVWEIDRTETIGRPLSKATIQE